MVRLKKIPDNLNAEEFRDSLQKKVPVKKFKRKSKPKVTDKEGKLQGWAEDYLDGLDVSYVRLPDTLMRVIFSSQHISGRDKKFISSYLKGLPDLIIFHPKKVGKYSLTLPLELKTEAGEMSPYQLDWQERIGTIEAKGWKEIKNEIDLFLDVE